MAECNNGNATAVIGNTKDKFQVTKYPVGSDVDPEIIFNFPYILDKETVSYIENYARVMFIIRGPPSTGKATLSEMLTNRYPDAAYCCADKYFTNSFARAERTKESIKSSHFYCQNRVENACENNAQTIIVQNTHMRKWEMQIYLDFAAQYNYTVVMAITLYRFDCTPKALAENNTDGLNINYFRKRLAQWEDVMPMFTGWFLSPSDSQHILHNLRKSLEALLTDGKFCRIFNTYDSDDLLNYFQPRKVLCCIAAYTKNFYSMKKYYLTCEVQASYGQSFTVSLFGYLISPTSVLGIVSVDSDMKHLLADFNEGESKTGYSDFNDMFSSLNLATGLQHYSATTSYPAEDTLPQMTTVAIEDIQESSDKNIRTYAFIDLAQKTSKPFDINANLKDFDALKYLYDDSGFINCERCTAIDCDDKYKIYRLVNDRWLVKPLQKITVKSVFTGLYI